MKVYKNNKSNVVVIPNKNNTWYLRISYSNNYNRWYNALYYDGGFNIKHPEFVEWHEDIEFIKDIIKQWVDKLSNDNIYLEKDINSLTKIFNENKIRINEFLSINIESNDA